MARWCPTARRSWRPPGRAGRGERSSTSMNAARLWREAEIETEESLEQEGREVRSERIHRSWRTRLAANRGHRAMAPTGNPAPHGFLSCRLPPCSDSLTPFIDVDERRAGSLHLAPVRQPDREHHARHREQARIERVRAPGDHDVGGREQQGYSSRRAASCGNSPTCTRARSPCARRTTPRCCR